MNLYRLCCFISRGTVIAITVIVLSFPVLASDGDREESYRRILKRCTSNCKSVIKSLSFSDKYLLGWNCLSTCRYRSMWENESGKDKKDRLKVQYHGKWPFRTFLGIQEPGSAILSIGNLLSHYAGLTTIRLKTTPTKKDPAYNIYRKYLVINSTISMVGWGCSAIFHSRDLALTEKMDYFGAAAILLIGLNMAILRCFILEGQRRFKRIKMLTTAVSAVLLLIFVLHCLKMLRKFDFGWNMKVCIFWGVGQCLIWLGWIAIAMITKNNVFFGVRKYCLFAVTLTLAASSLEIFDIPPIWGILDSHALWHLATIPIIFVWYKFYITDLLTIHTSLSSSSSSSSSSYPKTEYLTFG